MVLSGLILMAVGVIFTKNIQLPQSSKIDTQLVNSWVSIPKKADDNKIRLSILKFNDHELLISWKQGDNETSITRGFITEIDNVRIINTQNIKTLDEKERTFVFFKYSISNNGVLKTQILSDSSVVLKGKRFDSSEEFSAFIKKNINSKDLFGQEMEFIALETFELGIN